MSNVLPPGQRPASDSNKLQPLVDMNYYENYIRELKNELKKVTDELKIVKTDNVMLKKQLDIATNETIKRLDELIKAEEKSRELGVSTEGKVDDIQATLFGVKENRFNEVLKEIEKEVKNACNCGLGEVTYKLPIDVQSLGKHSDLLSKIIDYFHVKPKRYNIICEKDYVSSLHGLYENKNTNALTIIFGITADKYKEFIPERINTTYAPDVNCY